jgi:hypothetical protein
MDDPTKVLEMLSELHTPPGLDMSAITGRYTRADAMFAEVNDEGDPPAFAETSHQDFLLDFETVLGFYDADERRIICFPKGIAFVGKVLNVDSILIERIVRYHESAHALHHLGLAKTNIMPFEAAALSMNNESYRRTSDEMKEQIAQLATLVVIRTRRQDVSNPNAQKIFDLMLEAFFTLMQRQTPRYQLPPKTRDADLARLRDKLHLLFDMSDASVFPSADHIRRIID